jgi:DASH complex subunit DAD1
MTHTNILNRKLEEVHGVGKEFGTVAALWCRFQGMVRDNQVSGEVMSERVRGRASGESCSVLMYHLLTAQNEQPAEAGVPGTGGTNFVYRSGK